MARPCPCGRKLTYETCCGRFIDGGQAPSTAAELMRSRFTAYGEGAVDYLVRTTGGAARESLDRVALTEHCKAIRLVKLEIVKTEGGGPTDSTGVVAFRAILRQGGQKYEQTERSRFARAPETGHWVYVDGEID
jgi:SEC-C motif-containing protein